MHTSIIYCRVSTEEQAEQGYSLDAQEKYCRQFAHQNGYRVAAVYRDEGKSGTTLDRPALQELLSSIQQRKFVQAVIVQETDRLARNTKDHLTIRALLQKAGVTLISVAQPMLDDSPEGKMIDTIIASVNQFQSDINSRKTKKGLQEKFDSGWWPGWAPLGYLSKTTKGGQKIVVPDPEKWPLLRTGFKLYLAGNYSAIEIADRLYQKGLRSHTGKRLCNSVITGILKNPFYAGVMRWNRQEKTGNHKPMIAREEHYQVLQILNAHNLHASRRRTHQFLLRGFVFCHLCGGRYTAERHPRKNIAYYHCAFDGKRGSERLHANQGQNIEVKELEHQIEEKFKDIQFNPEFIALVTQKVQALYAQQKEVIDAEKRALLNQKLALEQKRYVVEEKLLNRVISDDDFGRMKMRIEEDLSQIQDKLDDLENKRNYDIDIFREILKLAENVHRVYQTAPYELKRQLLGLFWDKFLVQDKRIIEAIPTRLVQHLIKNKTVIIRSDLLRGQDSNLQPIDYTYLTVSNKGGLYLLRS